MTLAGTQWLQWSPLASRLAAFVVAATVTWDLNRRYTFRSSAGVLSLVSYIFLAAFGAAINMVVYLVWLKFAGLQAMDILFGVAFGSAVGLVFNYCSARFLIFRERRARD
jgi:putative flippase GtrA